MTYLGQYSRLRMRCVLTLLSLGAGTVAYGSEERSFIEKKVAGIEVPQDFGAKERVERGIGDGHPVPYDLCPTVECVCYTSGNALLILAYGTDYALWCVEVSLMSEGGERRGWMDGCKYVDISLVTEKGIALGDPVEKVINAYGRPTKRSREKRQYEKLEWSTDHQKEPSVDLVYVLTVQARRGKVTSLRVCDGP